MFSNVFRADSLIHYSVGVFLKADSVTIVNESIGILIFTWFLVWINIGNYSETTLFIKHKGKILDRFLTAISGIICNQYHILNFSFFLTHLVQIAQSIACFQSSEP